MKAADFAAIIAEQLGDGRARSYAAEANNALAAKVPALCQTCDGSGCAALGPNGHDAPCRPCPDCPTIGRLLAIGAAVMADDWCCDVPDELQPWSPAFDSGVDAAVTHLRAVHQ